MFNYYFEFKSNYKSINKKNDLEGSLYTMIVNEYDEYWYSTIYV